MKKKAIVEIIAALFILLFVYTATSKLFNPARFHGSLSKSPLIAPFADFIVYALPIAELIIAVLLFFPKSKGWGLYSSFGIMSLFTLYVGYMILFAAKLPCSCGGVIQQMSWQQHLWFNIGWTTVAGIAIVAYRKQDVLHLPERERLLYS